MKREWWISCNAFTCLVVTDRNYIIVETGPILRKFVGQPFDNLAYWLNSRFESWQWEVIKESKK